MKKIFTLLSFLPVAAIAQPVINSYTPIVGSKVEIYEIKNPIATSFPKTGNQTWNFGSEPTDTVMFTAEIINLASAPDAASFPTANIVQKLTMGGTPMVYGYARVTADSLWGMAVRYPTMPALNEDYTDANVSFRFPFALNGVIDDISVSQTGADTTRRKYVAWGDITTPYGTYPNVILCEESRQNNGTMTLESYLWISAATLDNIAEINVDDSLGEWHKPNIASSIGQEQLFKKYNLNVYPNPSTDFAKIAYSLPTSADISIQIIGMNGQQSSVLFNGKQQAGEYKLDTKSLNLAAGTYFARIVINNEPMVKRFTIVQ